MAGAPLVSAMPVMTAAVHINVGGSIYSTTLETLTKYPDTKIAKLFNGSLAIALDPVKQSYFLDRDGKMFRHILNFLRNCELILPDNFTELDLLLREACYYGIEELVKLLKEKRSSQSDDVTDSQSEDDSYTKESGHQYTNRRSKKKRTKKSLCEECSQEKIDDTSKNNSKDKYDKANDTRNLLECSPTIKIPASRDVLFVLSDEFNMNTKEIWCSNQQIMNQLAKPSLHTLVVAADEAGVDCTNILTSTIFSHGKVSKCASCSVSLEMTEFTNTDGTYVCRFCNPLYNEAARRFDRALSGTSHVTTDVATDIRAVARLLLIHGYSLQTTSYYNKELLCTFLK